MKRTMNKTAGSFEEIKKMALYFRDCSMYYLECYDLSQEEIQEHREIVDYDNELLQLDYSLANLLRLKGFKEINNEFYQECLNDSDLQERLQRWRQLKNTPEETNRREFEEIKKMALYFRDCSMYYLECYDLSQEKIQKHREIVDYDNELLQLDYSLANLSILKGFKEINNEFYQECLNDSDLQERLQRWRQLKNTPEETNRREFEEIKKMVLYFRDRSLFYLDWYDLSQEEIQEERENVDYHNELLQLDYSLKNLLRLKGFKEANKKIYQSELNNKAFQNDLREWRNGDKPGFFESIFNDLFGK